MPEETRYLNMNIHATALRPLLGLTVLVVEDSRYASEAVRLLCIRSGARIRRADSLTAAHRHLKVYRPSVVIVDLGLPDGSGLDLIEKLAKEDASGRPILIATSGADDDGQSKAALAAGAVEFMAKPFASVSAFQHAIMSHLSEDARPTGPRLLSDETISPDPIALNEDLSHVDDLLGTGLDTLPYVTPFLQGLARLTGDQDMRSASDALSKAFASGKGISGAVTATRDMIHARLRTRELV